jgi:hypothetical protein
MGLFGQVDFPESFKSYGPVWVLVGFFLMGFAGLFITVVQGVKYVVRLLFDTDCDQNGNPKGLLIPFINAHLGVFRRTEIMVEAMRDATELLATNAKDTRDHTQRMEQLMIVIEGRLKALDQTNNVKIHRTLVHLTQVLLDSMEQTGCDKSLIDRHRNRLQSLLKSAE